MQVSQRKITITRVLLAIIALAFLVSALWPPISGKDFLVSISSMLVALHVMIYPQVLFIPLKQYWKGQYDDNDKHAVLIYIAGICFIVSCFI